MEHWNCHNSLYYLLRDHNWNPEIKQNLPFASTLGSAKVLLWERDVSFPLVALSSTLGVNGTSPVLRTQRFRNLWTSFPENELRRKTVTCSFVAFFAPIDISTVVDSLETPTLQESNYINKKESIYLESGSYDQNQFKNYHSLLSNIDVPKHFSLGQDHFVR